MKMSYNNFQGADFTRTDLSWSIMTNCNFQGVSFREASLRCTNLTGSDLRGADFTGADLYCATLDGCDLDGVIGLADALQRARAEEARVLQEVMYSGQPIAFWTLQGQN